MKDIISYFEKTLDYFECIISENQLDEVLVDNVLEQRENLKDFRNLLNQYEENIPIYIANEAIESDETLNKLMKLHKFLTDIEWHISEINDLKNVIIKECSSRRRHYFKG